MTDAPDSNLDAERPISVAIDPHLTVHWELQFGRPIVSPGLIARLWVDKLKEQWIRDELETERANPVSWLRRAWVVLEVIVVVMLLGVLGALAPFAGVWLLAGVFGHPPVLVALVAVLAIHFTLGTAYMGLTLALHRDPTARRVMTWGIRIFGLVALPLTMYALSAPSTTRFEAFAPDRVDSLPTWLVYFGYMFVNVVGLGAPQAIFGELASLKPASFAAGAGTFWVNTLMAISVFETLRVLGGYYLLQRKAMTCTVGELQGFLRDKFNGRRYAKACVVAKHVELETAHQDVATLVRDLDPALPWRLLSDGRLIAVQPETRGSEFPPDRAAGGTSEAVGPRAIQEPPSGQAIRAGWSPLFAAATFLTALMVLSGTICTATGISIGAPLPTVVIVGYAAYLTVFALNVRGTRRIRRNHTRASDSQAHP